VLEALAQEITRTAPHSVSVLKGSELVSLIPEPCDGKDRRGSSGSSAIEAINRVRLLFRSVELAAGLGRAHVAPDGLAESGLEARNALLVQSRFSPSAGLLSFDDLGVYSLLYQVADTAELRAFVDRVLGPLIAYDQKRNADLLSTLRAILDHNGSLLNAARFIGVHVNTIAYRNERIKTLSGLDLSRSDDRLMSYLALKIIDGLPTEGADPEPTQASPVLAGRLRALPSRAASGVADRFPRTRKVSR
jgi:sugar diacid utilization regulator